jgi:hypothetical protein
MFTSTDLGRISLISIYELWGREIGFQDSGQSWQILRYATSFYHYSYRLFNYLSSIFVCIAGSTEATGELGVDSRWNPPGTG